MYFTSTMVSPAPHDPVDEEARRRLARLRGAAVLVSDEGLKDPNFDSAVVLVCVHNSDGAYGLVINRPSHMPLSELFDGFAGVDRKKKMYVGGPVRQEDLQILQVTASPVPDAYRICDRVHLGGRWESIETILDEEGSSTRVFLGYSGWGPGQLEHEILAGAWEVYLPDIERLLLLPDERITGPLSGIQATLIGLCGLRE